MLSLSNGFNYFLCSESVTLRYRHGRIAKLYQKPALVEGIVLKDRKVAMDISVPT